MSTPILPLAVWDPGTNQNSIPANDNSLNLQILNGLVISDSTDAQPGSPTDGDIYIMTGAASGAQWALFDEFDLAIYFSGTWYARAPVEGIVVNVAGTLNRWDGAAYVPIAGGSGSASVAVQYVADTGSTADSDPGAGLLKWNNATQASATQLFLDDDTDDGVTLTALWAGLDAGGFLYLQSAADQDTWQIWEITSVTDATGYVKLGVALLANGGSFTDGDSMLVTLQQGPGGSGDVVGPASSVANNLAAFGDTSGKLLADSGLSIAAVTAAIADLAAAGVGEQFGVVLTDLNVTITREPTLFSHAAAATNAPTSGMGAGIHIPVSATAAIQIAVTASATPRSFWRAAASSTWGSWNEFGARVPNLQSVTSAATVTPTFSNDAVKVTALAVACQLLNPSGTAIPFHGWVIRLKDNGTARALTYDTQYRAMGVTLPITTVLGKTLYLGCIWNAEDSKVDVVAVAQEA